MFKIHCQHPIDGFVQVPQFLVDLFLMTSKDIRFINDKALLNIDYFPKTTISYKEIKKNAHVGILLRMVREGLGFT